jgi:hypothetical protein
MPEFRNDDELAKTPDASGGGVCAAGCSRGCAGSFEGAAEGADQGCGHHRRDSRQPAGGLRAGGGLHGTGDSSQTVFPAQTLDLGSRADGHHRSADRIEQRQQHAGQEHGRGLCGGHAAALQPARLQDGHYGLLGRRCAFARRRHPADDAALRAGWADLRAGAGSAGAGRLHGLRAAATASR